MRYAKFVLIALDQCVNALLGGWPDETLSSRAWRWHMAGKKWPCKFIDALFCWESNYKIVTSLYGVESKIKIGHCEDSFLSERNDRYLPPELRN